MRIDCLKKRLCENDNGEYESTKCLECWRNPLMKDHYEEKED